MTDAPNARIRKKIQRKLFDPACLLLSFQASLSDTLRRNPTVPQPASVV